MITIYKIPSGYSSYNLPIVNVSNQKDYRSIHRLPGNQREQNQKDGTDTSQPPHSIRDIPVFRRNWHVETFLQDYRRILIKNFQKVKIEGGGGILDLRSGTRFQELELETFAASRAAVS